jgi:hypothetical protein
VDRASRADSAIGSTLLVGLVVSGEFPATGTLPQAVVTIKLFAHISCYILQNTSHLLLQEAFQNAK